MHTPSAPQLARYFATLDLHLWCEACFDPDGKPRRYWSLTLGNPHDVYCVDGKAIHGSLADLWRAWHSAQPVLHLRHARAKELVRRYLDADDAERTSFQAWLERGASWTPHPSPGVSMEAWPWTSALLGSTGLGELGTFGPPWTNPLDETHVRQCVRLGTGKGWARRGLRAARFDHQRADYYMDALRNLIRQEETRRMRRRIGRAGGARPAVVRKRL